MPRQQQLKGADLAHRPTCCVAETDKKLAEDGDIRHGNYRSPLPQGVRDMTTPPGLPQSRATATAAVQPPHWTSHDLALSTDQITPTSVIHISRGVFSPSAKKVIRTTTAVIVGRSPAFYF